MQDIFKCLAPPQDNPDIFDTTFGGFDAKAPPRRAAPDFGLSVTTHSVITALAPTQFDRGPRVAKTRHDIKTRLWPFGKNHSASTALRN